jgi:hypothetical protein
MSTEIRLVLIAISEDGAAFDAIAFKSVGPERLAKLCKKAKGGKRKK